MYKQGGGREGVEGCVDDGDVNDEGDCLIDKERIVLRRKESSIKDEEAK